MFPSHGKPPPLSPVLLAGLVSRPLPPRLLQPVLDAVFKRVMRKHPDLFDRLSGLGNPVYLIDPTDLPFSFLLNADPARPRMLVTVDGRDGVGNMCASATVRGPLRSLIDLLEGRMDGDALFFSRSLNIEGDTEAVVALRNAVDDANVQLTDDVLASLGPFSGPARRALKLGEQLYHRLDQDLEIVRASVHAHPGGQAVKGPKV